MSVTYIAFALVCLSPAMIIAINRPMTGIVVTAALIFLIGAHLGLCWFIIGWKKKAA